MAGVANLATRHAEITAKLQFLYHTFNAKFEKRIEIRATAISF